MGIQCTDISKPQNSKPGFPKQTSQAFEILKNLYIQLELLIQGNTDTLDDLHSDIESLLKTTEDELKAISNSGNDKFPDVY